MGFIWFWLVAVMIVGYVVLDGFDLGVGVLHLFLVRNEAERKATLRSIGPVWDGNEVWLLAGGGTLYFAFPLLYASAFSGFYLPLMIVLWLLILRGMSLELRNHIDVGVWRALLDGVFGLASALLTIFYGAALANVIRGVPLQADGYFFLPLWTNWQPGVVSRHSRLVHGHRRPGGAGRAHAARRALAHHQDLRRTGAARAQASSRRSGCCWSRSPSSASSPPSPCAPPASTTTTTTRSPSSFPWAWSRRWPRSGSGTASAQPLKAFLASCLYLFFMLAGACWGSIPRCCPPPPAPANDITLSRAISGPHTLAVGLAWWSLRHGARRRLRRLCLQPLQRQGGRARRRALSRD